MSRESIRRERTGAWWSAQARKRVAGSAARTDWSSSPLVDSIINRRVAGVETRNWLGWLRENYIKETLDLGLSIGCGTGLLERDAIEQGLCRQMVGIDIAEGALEIARRKGEGLPVTYERVDLECETLPPDKFDIVFSAGALHHINRFDFCVEQLHACLKEDGLLGLSEYTGPYRWQWGPLQMKLVFDMYSFLPPSYLYNYSLGGRVLYPQRQPISSMVMDDPSESVRSEDMLEVVERYFERLERSEFGGTLLNPFLSGILENFDEDDDFDVSLISLVAEFEELLIEGGTLSSDFVVDVYRRRPSLVGSEEIKRLDLGRSDEIARQERVIEESAERLCALRTANETFRKRIADTAQGALEEGAKAARLQVENSRLKKGALFRAVRFAKGAGKGPVTVETAPCVTPEQSPQVPAVIDGYRSLTSAESMAIKNHVAGIGRGNGIFWLGWLRDAVGVRGGKALMAGLEPGCAEVAILQGVCRSVDLVNERALTSGAFPSARYDIVFLDMSASTEGRALVASVARLLGDKGILIVTGHGKGKQGVSAGALDRLTSRLPRDWSRFARVGSMPPSEGGLDEFDAAASVEFTLERARGFGSWANLLVSEILPQVIEGKESMASTLASILFYCESILIEYGLLPPTLELHVYRKGVGPSRCRPVQDSPPRDIVMLQEREIDRLKKLEREEERERARLEIALIAETENIDRVAADLDWLMMERRLLEKRGLSRYLSIFLARRRKMKSCRRGL